MFICARVVSFAALALRARAANDTTRAQINNIPSKSHVIPLLYRLDQQDYQGVEKLRRLLHEKLHFKMQLCVIRLSVM